MWFLALRYIFSRKRQSLLIIGGVVLGTVAFTLISGIMTGFRGYIIEQLVNNDAHIRINPGEHYVNGQELKKIYYPESAHVFWNTPPAMAYFKPWIVTPQRWFDFLAKNDGVLAYTPQLVRNVTLRHTGVERPARLIGTNPIQHMQVTAIEHYMVNGDFKDLGLGRNRLIIGIGLLRKLGANQHDTIFVTNQQNATFPFQLVGVFQTGVSSFDENNVFTALADAQMVQHTVGQISDIAVRLKHVTQAHRFAAAWSQLFPEKIQSWDQINANLLAIFNLQQLIGILMIVAVLAVTGAGIYNTLFMLISHRRQEIAILRSIGYDASDINRLFLWQGLCFGGCGGLLGCVLGYLSGRYIETISISALRVSQAGHLIISFEPSIYAKAFSLAMVACLLASTFPARAAGRLSPMDVIRSE